MRGFKGSRKPLRHSKSPPSVEYLLKNLYNQVLVFRVSGFRAYRVWGYRFKFEGLGVYRGLEGFIGFIGVYRGV